MMFRSFRRTDQAGTIGALYGAIVAQARHPTFYRCYRVPDTIDGRFDMIVLHVALFSRRIRGESGAVRALGQAVFDRFCRDMDHNLREMGIGDLAVPKRTRDFGEAFYGRAQSYDRALASGDDRTLIATLAKNVFARPGEAPPEASRLARYVRAAEHVLAAQNGADFLAGALAFPAPDTIFPGQNERSGMPSE